MVVPGIRRMLVAAVAALVTIGPCGSAAAQETVALGGGSGILLGSSTACTLTTIGYDRAGRLTGLTAGHCAEPGMPVRAEATPDTVVVGTVAAVDHSDDYAVIVFDRERVTPVRRVDATVIAGIGAPPREGDLVCKNGRTTGVDCGLVWATHEWWFQNQVCSRPGDSGGPVTLGDRLVGMNVGHIGTEAIGITLADLTCRHPAASGHDPAVAIQIGMVLAAIEQAGGPGAGFRPV
ncbi:MULTISPECIES: S1 family peptidase [unclassified Nocardia]|uniref:S1 family peptidase n=1 Tax=unclassified Nocardia TaxID=2637762 RepID=UPI001CE47E51|nr:MULTISPECIES: S1 family peptidase [unclassified Nocardia]